MRLLAVVVSTLLWFGLVPGILPARAIEGFALNNADLAFILKQIQISERHAASDRSTDPCNGLLGPDADQIPATGNGVTLPWGVRTVDGSCNNLQPGQAGYGAGGLVFPRRAPADFRAPYGSGGGMVTDPQPRVASNLIVDQTSTNPAAETAWRSINPDVPPTQPAPTGESLFIPNTAPDVGLSAPFNSMFTLFGQFFDHGLDLVPKAGSPVIVPLQPDDPLFRPGASTNFMVLTRATTASGDPVNKTSSFVDQSQTYTSHPSHQVFLREYESTGGRPLSTGRMLTGPGDGLATWASVKAQARTLLGIELSDTDVLDVPLLLTDPYGRFVPGANGLPQLATESGLVEGNTTTPVAVPSNAIRTGHSFLDDIAHHAVPTSRTGAPLTPDGDAGTTDDGNAASYDDEMLAAHFVAGDGRINENIGLTAVHHVFHSEHNRLRNEIDTMIAALPATVQAQWRVDNAASGWGYGERLFQAARFVTEMEYQHLAFEEFARKVQPQVNVFAGYDTDINPAIPAEFAHAVYRFGHSMLTETVARRGTQGDIPLLDAFLNPPAFYATSGGQATPEEDVGNIVRGMTDQVGNEIDEFVTEALRNKLLGLPLDLATLNLARGRDTGMPRLNAARAAFHAATNGNSALTPYQNWIDFGLALRHPESLVNFVAAYGTHPTITGDAATRRAAAALLVAGDTNNPATPADATDFMNGTGAYGGGGGLNDVDLWIGGLAEKQSPFGGMLGSTFNYVFETSMENLQDGDRFYYLTRTAGLNLLVQLEGNSFAEMISRNSNATNLPADVFSVLDRVFDLAKQNATGPIVEDPDTSYSEVAELSRMADGTIRYAGALHVMFVGTPNTDRVRSSEGDDTLRGNAAADRLEGGDGNDQHLGGAGNDVLTDTFGDDTLKGGDGNDALSSGPGFDLNQGQLGDDFVVGGSEPTETFGGPGDDIVFGGDSSDTVFGDDGDDWIEGGNQADLLQGDNGAPFQDDPNTPGHDVIDGDGGNDDYDAEGGNDIMIAGPGVERNEGMLGFDWVTHKNDPQAANDDMRITGLLPPSVEALRDRFDLVEAISGGLLADTLRGDDRVAADLAGHELDAAGIALVSGLAGILPPGATSFSGGNILVGGANSDVIEGRGGDDLIDGDVWLNVQLQAGSERVDSLSALRDRVFAGTLDPGSVDIWREIVTPAPPPAGTTWTDVAVFSGPRADYDITSAGGVVTVAHARGAATDGTDTVRNVETLRFTDQDVATAALIPPAAPTITSVVPGDASVTVNFTAGTGGEPATSFVARSFAGTTAGPTATVAATATSAVVTGLTNGTAYTFTVEAVNAGGASAPSAPSVSVTPAPAATVPGAPTGVTATPGNAQATVTWTPPASTGGSPITGYSVRVFTGTTQVGAARPATGTSLVVSGLTNGRAYTFDVAAINAVGTGPFSVRSAPVTPAAADLTAPTVTARTPGIEVFGVNTGANTSARFSENVLGVSGTTVVLRNAAGTQVPAVVTYNASTFVATLNPNAALATDTRYTVTLTGGAAAIRDAAGNPLVTTSWSFTTGPRPVVTARSPLAGASGVSRTANVTATFGEEVLGVTATTFSLRPAAGGPAVTAVVSRNGTTNQWILDPSVTLAPNTQYRATLTGGALTGPTTNIRDRAGNALATLSWTFATGA